MNNEIEEVHDNFNRVIETKLNKAISDYMNNVDDSELLDKIK